MSNKLKSATGLYLEGIRDGRVRDAVTKYTGDRYTQHSTGVKDGVEGFVEFFEPFIKRNSVRDIQVIRSIVDGQYVFVHVYQSLNNGEAKWVTADLFDTDKNDKIIEHWDSIQEFVEETASGRSMVDGPTEIQDLDKTEQNRTLVEKFCQDVLIDGKFDTITDFISPTQYDQHNPTVEDGLEGLYKHVQEFKKQGITARYIRVYKVICQGNFAVALSHTMQNEDNWCFFDIFRIENGRIVEHWDVQEKILPQEQWSNSGKF